MVSVLSMKVTQGLSDSRVIVKTSLWDSCTITSIPIRQGKAKEREFLCMEGIHLLTFPSITKQVFLQESCIHQCHSSFRLVKNYFLYVHIMCMCMCVCVHVCVCVWVGDTETSTYVCQVCCSRMCAHRKEVQTSTISQNRDTRAQHTRWPKLWKEVFLYLWAGNTVHS